MANVFVIPDIHLKPEIIKKADEICEKNNYDKIVTLGDIVDDWNKERDIGLYNDTFDVLIAFLKKYPNTYLCYGNHDMSYIWEKYESGYSPYAREVVVRRLKEVRDTLKEGHCAYIHRIDNTIFSHGGLMTSFIIENFGFSSHKEIDEIISDINSMWCDKMWRDDSPIWARPQYGGLSYPAGMLQVVGHTPMEAVTLCDDFLSVDVFSTYNDGTPIGTQVFVEVDTVTKQYKAI